MSTVPSRRPFQLIAVSRNFPEGSVLGPIQFISYTEDVTVIFETHKLRHHLFAYDNVVDHHYGLFPFSRVCAYFLAYLLSEAYLAWKIPAIGVEPFQHPL